MAERNSSRDKDYSGRARYRKDLDELYDLVTKAFDDKKDQISAIERYWQIFNCELTTNQTYQGNSQIYLPAVRDAIEARVTRFTNMLFPESEQHVEVIDYSDAFPHGLVALLNHYVNRAQLRLLTPALLRNGEVEGHYSIYLDWQKTSRFVTKKVEIPVELAPGIDDPRETYLDIEDEEIEDNRPRVELIGAADVAVVPPTAESIATCEAVGIVRRMTKGAVRVAEARGLFTADAVSKLMKNWDTGADYNQLPPDAKKKVQAAGVKMGDQYAVIIEVWKRMKIDGDRRWCRIFYGGQNLVLGFTVNPNWNDRCSLISLPRTKVSGSFWGKSPCDAVEQIQYQINDAVNMGMDSAQYSLLPIVMTDPEKNPRVGSMVMNVMAIWETSPTDTQILQIPQLWHEALAIVEAGKNQIMQSFGLNPAMMPQGAGAGRKPSQAQVAQEQAVSLESIANEVTMLEHALYSPMLQFFFEMDQQHRNEEMAIKVYGQMGVAAKMERVPPFAWDDRYEILWRGVSTFKSAQNNQQMIAGMNILRALGPVLPNGMKIDIAPIIETLVENVFGPRLGSRILVDARDQLSMDPQLENEVMEGGMDVPVHQLDDDKSHIQAHLEAFKSKGDPTGLIRTHTQRHMMQMQAKMQAQQPKGEPGVPGGAGPGVAGTPKPGAQPAQATGGQAPPGTIQSDQIQDPSRMPRRAA